MIFSDGRYQRYSFYYLYIFEEANKKTDTMDVINKYAMSNAISIRHWICVEKEI